MLKSLVVGLLLICPLTARAADPPSTAIERRLAQHLVTLDGQIKKLQDDNEQLQANNEQLRTDVAKLKKENVKLAADLLVVSEDSLALAKRTVDLSTRFTTFKDRITADVLDLTNLFNKSLEVLGKKAGK